MISNLPMNHNGLLELIDGFLDLSKLQIGTAQSSEVDAFAAGGALIFG